MRTQEKRDRHAAYMRDYNRRPERIGKKSASDKRYRQKNLEKLREYDRSRYASRREYNKVQYAEYRRRPEVRERLREYGKAYYQANKEKSRRHQQERRKRVGERWSYITRWYSIKHKHGIGEKEFNEMLKAQGGVCAICSGPPTGRNKQWHIDHDHENGKIRGLLCMRCNGAMERLDSCPGWALKADEYKRKLR